MTLHRLLTEGTECLQKAGEPEAALDARTLLLEAFHLDLVHFLTRRMEPLPETEETARAAEAYRRMVARRSRR